MQCYRCERSLYRSTFSFMPKRLQLGRPAPIPASPTEAVLDRVRNPHPDTNYVARFTFPEFTVMCPVTGQPDFATLVIDYVPRAWLVESKSLKLYLNSFRTVSYTHLDVYKRQAFPPARTRRSACRRADENSRRCAAISALACLLYTSRCV